MHSVLLAIRTVPGSESNHPTQCTCSQASSWLTSWQVAEYPAPTVNISETVSQILSSAALPGSNQTLCKASTGATSPCSQNFFASGKDIAKAVPAGFLVRSQHSWASALVQCCPQGKESLGIQHAEKVQCRGAQAVTTSVRPASLHCASGHSIIWTTSVLH